ncbi:S-adenosylmethionine synthetase [Aspergillus falconensis]
MKLEPESTFLFTSESVGEGHSDQVCDQVADAILDECLKHDPLSKVAIEVAVRSGLVIELDYRTCQIMDYVELGRPPQASNGVSSSSGPSEKEAAGDQGSNPIHSLHPGMVFGCATDETTQPLTIDLAHRITRALKAASVEGSLPWLRPDSKAQVTVEYKQDGHTPALTVEELRQAIRGRVIRKSILAHYLDDGTVYRIQRPGDVGVTPSGKFAGVTGRKIVVDTYGGWGAHGGGAFSGKDFHQVDRSAAYIARWIARSVVHHGPARRCLIHLSYSSGTSQLSVNQLKKIVLQSFDLRPAAIAKALGLTKPMYYRTAKNGHFTSQLGWLFVLFLDWGLKEVIPG